MLRVYVYEVGAEGAEEGELHGGVVGEGAAFASRQHLAPQHELVVVVDIGLGEEGFQSQTRYVELSLDDTLAVAVGEHGAVGPLAQQQPQGTEHDALAGTSFAGDGHKALAEADVALTNEGVVFDMESG